MIKLDNNNDKSNHIIDMLDMSPLQVAIFLEDDGENIYVMRTASAGKFEVMDLSTPGIDRCWTNISRGLKVKLLEPEEEVVLRIYNEEVGRKR